MTSKNIGMCWIDCEMTGLDIFQDEILEVAVVLTDNYLNIVDSQSYVIHHSENRLMQMDTWNTTQHKKSGLWEHVLGSQNSYHNVESRLLDWISQYIDPKKIPLCGNSVHQDRYFLKRLLPRFEEYLHYRVIDVSTLKQLIPLWFADCSVFKKDQGIHRAHSDIIESINELRYYKNFLQEYKA